MAINKITSSFHLFSVLFFAAAFLSSAEGNDPYYFDSSSFQTMLNTTEGIVRLLPKFTDRSPRLFRGIENARIFVLETAPETFVMPHHSDHASIFVVVKGQGIIELVTQNEKNVFFVKQGDVVRVESGSIGYAYNIHSSQRLRIAMLFLPVNNPGLFDNFFLPGLDGQPSYLQGFSTEVLTSSLNVSIQLINEVLREQQGVTIIRPIPAGQLDELRRLESTLVRHEPSGFSGSGSFDILSLEPIYSNEFGKFYEASPDNFELLKDLSVSVTWSNMTKSAIFVPHYNSKATTIVFVASGCGRFEMAAFNDSGAITWYVSEVCEGEVYVIPAAHPVAFVSLVPNNDNNFVSIGFGINADNNSRNFLAGYENVIKKLGSKASRLAFGVEPEVVEKAFNSQTNSYFVDAVTTPHAA